MALFYGIGLATHRLQVRVLTGHHHVVALGKLPTPVPVSASVTKLQYNLVLAKGQRFCSVDKVTASLAECTGSLPPDF